MDTELELRYDDLLEKFNDDNYSITRKEIEEQVALFYAMTGLARIDLGDVIIIPFCVD